VKPREAKALLQTLIEKGHVLHGDRLYTPQQAAALNILPVKKARAKRGEAKRYSDNIDEFCHYVKLQTGISLVTEYRFDMVRKWKFDYANEELKLAIEQEGGIYRKGGGAHSSPAGILRDMEKYTQASIQGWTLIRRTPQQMQTQETINLILSAIKRHENIFL
jgi:hypothetical protein